MGNLVRLGHMSVAFFDGGYVARHLFVINYLIILRSRDMKLKFADLRQPPDHDITQEEAIKLLSQEFNNQNLIAKGMSILKGKEILSPQV